MVPAMKANILKEKSMEKENFNGQMVVSIPVILMTIIFMERVSMNGLMEEFTMEIGLTTKWKVMELSHGQMVEDM